MLTIYKRVPGMKIDDSQFKLWLIIAVLLLFLGFGFIILLRTVEMKNKAEKEAEQRKYALWDMARENNNNVNQEDPTDQIELTDESISTNPGTEIETTIQPLAITADGFPFTTYSIPPVTYPFENQTGDTIQLTITGDQRSENYTLEAGEQVRIPFLELGTYTVRIDGSDELTIIVE